MPSGKLESVTIDSAWAVFRQAANLNSTDLRSTRRSGEFANGIILWRHPGLRHVEPGGRIGKLYLAEHMDELAAKVDQSAIVWAELRLERLGLALPQNGPARRQPNLHSRRRDCLRGNRAVTR
jgi:hypothetical protein